MMQPAGQLSMLQKGVGSAQRLDKEKFKGQDL
jgi:hypothetical protein